MAEELINKIKETTTTIIEIAEDLRDSGLEIVNTKLEEINNSINYISKSGFTLKGIDTKLGIPPEIVGTFSLDKDISDEEWEKLIAETSELQTVNLILKSLNKAEQIAGKLKVGAFELDSVTILFSIPPGIGMKFKPKR
jgi:replicative DNA helicase